MTFEIKFAPSDREVICSKTKEAWMATCLAMRHAYRNCSPTVPHQAVWLLGSGTMPTSEYWQAIRMRITRMRAEYRLKIGESALHRREYMREYMRKRRLSEAIQAENHNHNA
jgi:hypothetical protein